MARKEKPFTYSAFVGGRPIEELTPQEREHFEESAVRRMGEVLNNWFSDHPEVYERVMTAVGARPG